MQNRGLLNRNNGFQDRIPLYLHGDKGYPNLSWMLTPHKEDGREHSLLEQLFNKRHRRAISAVENTFGMMKEDWRELLVKTNMHVSIVPNMFVY